MSLKALLTRILEALSVDYIVEEGTDGIWTYIKRKSGIAECWGIKSGTANHTRTWAGLSICDAINVSFPTDLFIATPATTITNIGANSAVTFNGGATTQYQVPFQLGRGANANNIAYAVSIIAKGRWK